MAICVRCGRELSSFSTGELSPLCRDCRAHAAEIVPSNEISTSPPPVRTSQPFSLTQIIVGINVAIFVAMALSGVSPLAPTVQQLVKWGANFALCPWDHSPGESWRRTTFISGSSTFFSICGACGIWADWRSEFSIPGLT
jgi:hypothetical protein